MKAGQLAGVVMLEDMVKVQAQVADVPLIALYLTVKV